MTEIEEQFLFASDQENKRVIEKKNAEAASVALRNFTSRTVV